MELCRHCPPPTIPSVTEQTAGQDRSKAIGVRGSVCSVIANGVDVWMERAHAQKRIRIKRKGRSSGLLQQSVDPPPFP